MISGKSLREVKPRAAVMMSPNLRVAQPLSVTVAVLMGGAAAALLGSARLALAVGYLLTGGVPPIIGKVGHPTNVIAALDLSMVVSINAWGAVWLWKGRPRSYVVATMANGEGAAYMLAFLRPRFQDFFWGRRASLRCWPFGAGSASDAWLCPSFSYRT